MDWEGVEVRVVVSHRECSTHTTACRKFFARQILPPYLYCMLTHRTAPTRSFEPVVVVITLPL